MQFEEREVRHSNARFYLFTYKGKPIRRAMTA
jgi:hypothetical protein